MNYPLPLSSHISIDSTADIEKICRPLHSFEITHFTFLRNYHDGGKIHLSSSADWLCAYYQNKLYHSSIFEDAPGYYRTGYLLWDQDCEQEVFSYARESINSDHGITLISSAQDYCEFYFFSTFVGNPKIINFYLNNLDLLKRFTLYFKSEARLVIQKAYHQRIVVPELLSRWQSPPLPQNNPALRYNDFNSGNAREQFILETPISKLVLNLENGGQATLTPREFDCAMLLL